MALYECVFIARQDATSQQVEAIENLIKSVVVEEFKGVMKKKEDWGLMEFAYPIKKNQKGHYVLLNFEAPEITIKELDRRLKLNEVAIRHLVIKIEELEDGPSYMLKHIQGLDKEEEEGEDQ